MSADPEIRGRGPVRTTCPSAADALAGCQSEGASSCAQCRNGAETHRLQRWRTTPVMICVGDAPTTIRTAISRCCWFTRYASTL